MKPTVVVKSAALVLALTLAAACSKGKSSNPVAPSSPESVVAGPSGLTSGATISGVVVTASTSAFAAPLPISAFGARSLGAAGSVSVSVNGTSITTVCDSSGHFTLQNVPSGTLTLTVTGAGFSSQVSLPAISGDDQLRITVRVTNGTASLEDDEVESRDKVEIEGVIGSVSNLSSAGGTIVVGRSNTAVLVTPSTSITKGGTSLKPNDLTVGTRVHVRASKSGATLTATTIIVQNESAGSSNGRSGDDNENDDDEKETELSGVITDAPTGGCPANNSFTVGSTRVVTNASTKFDDTSCAALAKGDTVSVEGTKQTNGSILAKEVKKKNGGSGKRISE